jgi:hypothetical protein
LRAKVLGRLGRAESSPTKSACSILPIGRRLRAGASRGASRPPGRSFRDPRSLPRLCENSHRNHMIGAPAGAIITPPVGRVRCKAPRSKRPLQVIPETSRCAPHRLVSLAAPSLTPLRRGLLKKWPPGRPKSGRLADVTAPDGAYSSVRGRALFLRIWCPTLLAMGRAVPFPSHPARPSLCRGPMAYASPDRTQRPESRPPFVHA